MMESLKTFWERIKEVYANKWVKFGLYSAIYILWFVVWTQNLWLLLGLPIIYDIYISGYMERYVWSPNRAICQRNPLYKSIYGWVSSIVFALVVTTVLQTYVFQLYMIPTSSMEKSMLVGDRLWVSKLSYGPKMPNTPLSVPLTVHTMPFTTTGKSYSEAIQWGYKRLKGPRVLQRGDAVVFNFPAGDTVLLERQNVTYYDVLRSYQSRFGEDEGRARLEREYTISARPVDKRENYVKRAVAVAGDTIKIVESTLFVNGVAEPSMEGRQQFYTVHTSAPFTQASLDKFNITEAVGYGALYHMPLTQEGLEAISKMPNVLSVEQYISNTPSLDIFPNDEKYSWSLDNFGELWIPQKGVSVELTTDNLPLYRRIIEVYEGNTLEVEDEKIYINSEEVDSYTFKMDYYWMMGDNRHNSADSRFWGFVPEDHIVGKPLFVWFSLDAQKPFPMNLRWNRLFKALN